MSDDTGNEIKLDGMLNHSTVKLPRKIRRQQFKAEQLKRQEAHAAALRRKTDTTNEEQT